MLKVLLLAEGADANRLLQKLHGMNYKVVATIAPNACDENTVQEHKADIVLSSNAALTRLLAIQRKKQSPRQQVKAITHQGIRLVPVNNIYYFQAEHKYVNAFHTQGQLLIEDTLNGLEREFSDAFIRIHRKTLVAKDRVESLMKSDDGQYYVKLRGREEALHVSRRQLPQVRKILADL